MEVKDSRNNIRNVLILGGNIFDDFLHFKGLCHLKTSYQYKAETSQTYSYLAQLRT